MALSLDSIRIEDLVARTGLQRIDHLEFWEIMDLKAAQLHRSDPQRFQTLDDALSWAIFDITDQILSDKSAFYLVRAIEMERGTEKRHNVGYAIGDVHTHHPSGKTAFEIKDICTIKRGEGFSYHIAGYMLTYAAHAGYTEVFANVPVNNPPANRTFRRLAFDIIDEQFKMVGDRKVVTHNVYSKPLTRYQLNS